MGDSTGERGGPLRLSREVLRDLEPSAAQTEGIRGAQQISTDPDCPDGSDFCWTPTAQIDPTRTHMLNSMACKGFIRIRPTDDGVTEIEYDLKPNEAMEQLIKHDIAGSMRRNPER